MGSARRKQSRDKEKCRRERKYMRGKGREMYAGRRTSSGHAQENFGRESAGQKYLGSTGISN